MGHDFLVRCCEFVLIGCHVVAVSSVVWANNETRDNESLSFLPRQTLCQTRWRDTNTSIVADEAFDHQQTPVTQPNIRSIHCSQSIGPCGHECRAVSMRAGGPTVCQHPV